MNQYAIVTKELNDAVDELFEIAVINQWEPEQFLEAMESLMFEYPRGTWFGHNSEQLKLNKMLAGFRILTPAEFERIFTFD